MNDLAITKLLSSMKETKITQLLISDPLSIEYLVGYYTDPGERLLLLSIKHNGQLELILNGLFPAFEERSNLSIQRYHDGEQIIPKLAQNLSAVKIGIDKNWPSHFLIELMAHQPKYDYVNGSFLIDKIRAIKTKEEIDKMREASYRNDQVMQALIQKLDAHTTENDMKDHLALLYKEYECDGFSFEPIIAYGPHGADPHHSTDDSLPHVGQSVIIDIGSRYKGYCSDMTRTIFFGTVSKKHEEIYQTVLRANLEAIKHVKPGVSFASIDLAARKVIEDAGYGPYFTHRTGHFIGKDVHEYGDVSQYNNEIVQAGNVFSIEPGIYLPGEMGVRIEDLVIVTETGCEVINLANKDLTVIPNS
ncbi:M24 family metallopeptidase [Facklamia miroungae]|uniref:Xaa-Pro dipeptidase n=1 Tax=Facklamia miroungae TaxID=120956 RepID=A0A1G7S437_9LACT|nr:Xaa-Pro peptidase family protein [Facklamia miroungae]NKZ29171.1 aminopeptidase P family protein [Facklamia miroungae]SDG17827.1 Xaa-Pro dipeptidase [Facklamia miroungae]